MLDQNGSAIFAYSDAQRLAKEIFLRAIEDALKPKVTGGHVSTHLIRDGAIAWLASEEVEIFAGAAGFDAEKVKSWARSGCPIPESIAERDLILLQLGQRAKGGKDTIQ